MTTSNIRLDQIQANPWQTRHSDPAPDYIAELAADIETRGLLQIPIGRIAANGKSLDDPKIKIQLAFGHNRLAAYILLANQHPGGSMESPWARMPVDIRTLTDEEMADMAWAENERRRDHTPIDRALAIQKRMEDFGWNQAQVAEHLGISRPVVSNSLRLLSLPEEYQEKLRNGQISERQAISILPLFDLPKSILEKAESYWERDLRPSDVLEDAGKGVSSNEIRRRVGQIISKYGRDLHEAKWDLDEVFEVKEAIISADCRSCPARVKERNLCTDPDCYNMKTRIWERAYILKASEVSGIEPLASHLSRYDVTTFGYFTDSEHMPVIRSSGCENLRLYFNPNIYEYEKDSENRLKDLDFPNAEIVCSKRSGYCSCLKGLRYQETIAGSNGNEPEESAEEAIDETPTAEDLHDLARQARSEKRQAGRLAKEVVKIAGEAIAKALLENNLHVWKLMGREIHYKLGYSQNEETDFEKYLLAIGEYIAEQALPYSRDNFASILESVNEKLTGCGLDPIELEEVTT